MMLTAPNAYAISIGFSRGEQQAAKDFQNHSPFNPACGKHTSYYCAGWVKGYTTKWNSLVQTNPHIVPPPPTESSVKANISSIPSSNSTGTISIHTVNTIQGSNSSILVQEEPIIRKVTISNINNAILIAEGSVKNISSVNTKIINQLANRVSTTQGIDFTKALVATELVNAINAIKRNGNTAVVVDNQAICTGISPANAACTFTITIHS
jgi:hypothetical protein